MIWWWSAVFVVLAIAFAIEIACAVKRRRYRNYAGVLILLYSLALISWVVFGNGVEYYFVRSGLFTAILIIAIMSLHMIDLICNGRDEKKHE